jgi:hypothetical protein
MDPWTHSPPFNSKGKNTWSFTESSPMHFNVVRLRYNYFSLLFVAVFSCFGLHDVYFILWNISDSVGIYNFTGVSDKGISRTQSVVPILPAPSSVSPKPTTALLITTSTPVTVGQSLTHSSNQVSVLSVTLKPVSWDNVLPGYITVMPDTGTKSIEVSEENCEHQTLVRIECH